MITNQRKWVAGIFISISVFVIAFFTFLGPLLDRNINSIFPKPSDPRFIIVPELHQSLFVTDLHADTLLWDRPLLKQSAWGHVDLPRLQKGHIALQAFSVVTKTPLFPNIEKNGARDSGVLTLGLAEGWPAKTWSSLSERAVYQAGRLKEAIAQSQGQMRLILNHDDLMKFREDWQKNPNLVGAWLTIEGGHALDGDLGNLDRLYQEGFRMIGPAHLFDNDLAGSQSGEKKYGLTELGKKWVAEMDRRKMIIDLAHLSAKAIDDVLALSKRSPMVSHTGVQGVCPIARNLTDTQIKNIAARGGLIGIGLWKQVLCGEDLTLVVRSMKHVCALVGCKHVAIGSDWDGFVTTAVDSEHIGWLTAALMAEGFSEPEIRGIMGENAFRFLLENLP